MFYALQKKINKMAEVSAVFFFLSHCLFLAIRINKLVASNSPLVPALFIFGDSTVDSGNNNYFPTVSRANFPPYGQDFPVAGGHTPTGRFCNGRIVTDILSERLGLPDTVRAFLEPDFAGEKILTGASFASGASGFYIGTAIARQALDLGKQIDLFRQYKSKLVGIVGSANASRVISQGLFILSAGTVDFTSVYLIDPAVRAKYSLAEYQDFLIKSFIDFTQSIYNEGARFFVVCSLPPIGCLPSQITLEQPFPRKCAENLNEIAISTNQKLQNAIERLRQQLSGMNIIYSATYDILFQLSNDPLRFGFKESRKGCCGTGLYEASIFCNPKTPPCNDVMDHVYWDSFHPTTRAYSIIADYILPSAMRGR